LGFARANCGKKKGLGRVIKNWDIFLPFYPQWYWQQSLMYPYEKSKVFYHGPREKWMKLIKEKKNERRTRRK
jgi:hypothetical protein